jgi:hypothetical protein
MEEYERIKERIYNALVEVDAALNPPTPPAFTSF